MPLTPDNTICNFQFWRYFFFRLHEISYQNENFIRKENQNELIPEWPVWEQNIIFFVIMKASTEKYLEME